MNFISAVATLSADPACGAPLEKDGWIVAAAATAAPQLPQKDVSASNRVPHFVQNAIEIPFLQNTTCSGYCAQEAIPLDSFGVLNFSWMRFGSTGEKFTIVGCT
jgi:hypothetical protein